MDDIDVSDAPFEYNTSLNEWLEKNQCPRCGHFIPNDLQPGAYMGALSRWDNATEVCSPCGQVEAMLQWGTDDKRLSADHVDWYALLVKDIVNASNAEEAREVVAHMLNINSDA